MTNLPSYSIHVYKMSKDILHNILLSSARDGFWTQIYRIQVEAEWLPYCRLVMAYSKN